MEISSNLTLELADQPFLLEKRIDLLYAISKEGSILKAAKSVPMSYKSAWDAVDAMNNLSATPIVQRETGGSGGGGTKLTPYGENLLKTYRALKVEQKNFLERLKQITDIDRGTLKTIGRLSMRISARNQISGVVEHVNRGKVNAEVFIKLKSGYTLISNVTKGAVDTLEIKDGDEVVALFKSSSVLLTTDVSLKISGRNKLQGRVDSIHIGEVNAEIVVDIGNSDKIAAVITANSVKTLDIKVGSDITAIIKASDLMIGK